MVYLQRLCSLHGLPSTDGCGPEVPKSHVLKLNPYCGWSLLNPEQCLIKGLEETCLGHSLCLSSVIQQYSTLSEGCTEGPILNAEWYLY